MTHPVLLSPIRDKSIFSSAERKTEKALAHDHPRNQSRPPHRYRPGPLRPGSRCQRLDALPLPRRLQGKHENLPRNQHRLLLRRIMRSKKRRRNRLHNEDGQKHEARSHPESKSDVRAGADHGTNTKPKPSGRKTRPAGHLRRKPIRHGPHPKRQSLLRRARSGQRGHRLQIPQIEGAVGPGLHHLPAGRRRVQGGGPVRPGG